GPSADWVKSLTSRPKVNLTFLNMRGHFADKTYSQRWRSYENSGSDFVGPLGRRDGANRRNPKNRPRERRTKSAAQFTGRRPHRAFLGTGPSLASRDGLCHRAGEAGSGSLGGLPSRTVSAQFRGNQPGHGGRRR